MPIKVKEMKKFRDEIDKVEKLREGGWTANDIAALYDISPTAVRRACSGKFVSKYDGGERANIDFEMTPLKKFALCGKW